MVPRCQLFGKAFEPDEFASKGPQLGPYLLYMALLYSAFVESENRLALRFSVCWTFGMAKFRDDLEPDLPVQSLQM